MCACVCVCVYFNQIWEVLAIIVSNIFAAISVFSGASLVAQRLKHLPARRETQVQSLGREDTLEKENGNPLQYSCLENPMDGEAW